MKSSRVTLLWAFVGVIVVGGVAVRLTGLDVQNYWIDELFSVQQTNRDLRRVLRVGRTEVHPPTYAVLLWAWTRLGFGIGLTGDHTIWTHLLTALMSIGGIAASYLTLRRSTLPHLARALIVIATACSGFSLAYAQETRAYTLAWLAAIGATALTLRIIEAGREPHRNLWIQWGLWCALGSATHMFGAIIAVGTAATLAILSSHQWKRILTVGGLSLLPQVSWIILGLIVTPKFADGAKWAPAPDLESVAQLFRNTFSWGPLTQVEDGFYFHGNEMVAIMAIILLAAGITWTVIRSRKPEVAAVEDIPEKSLRSAVIALGVLSGGTIVAVFLFSQLQHVWLLRNMIVIAPALSWFVVLLILWLATTRAARLAFAATVTVALVVSLGVSTAAQRTPYKTGFRDAMYDAIAFRKAHPDGFVQHNVNNWWLLGTDIPRDDPSINKILLPGQRISPTSFPANIIRTDRPTLIVGMRLHLTDNEAKGRYIMESLGPDRCRHIIHKDVTVIWCDAPTAENPRPTSRPKPEWPPKK